MPHSFSKQTLALHQSPGGANYEVDVYNYQHPEAQKTVYLQGGLHGIELTGIPVIYEFMKEIEQHQLKTNFICVPQSNPMGLDSQIMGVQTGYNNLHTNHQNCWNWNRIGQLRDEPSIEGNWIRTLLELAEPADIILDLHTAGTETEAHIYAHVSQIDHAIGMGIPHLLAWEAASTSFSDTNVTAGKIALTFELSSSRSITSQRVEEGIMYLKRFFKIEPEVSGTKIWHIKGKLKKLYAPAAGVLCWKKDAGVEVKEGEVVAELYTRNGKQAIHAPWSGVFLIKYLTYAPYSRQEIGKFLID